MHAHNPFPRELLDAVDSRSLDASAEQLAE